MPNWAEYLAENHSRYRRELDELLRIPSISALPEHAGDVRKAGEWVADRMHAAGIEGVEIMETGGHPVVYGEWLHAPGKPTILLYGHFDVQPVDPLNLWESPPFEPTERNGRLYARGVSDMKANLYLQIVAAEALLKTAGELPINLRFFYEGQEEIGSPQVPAFLAANQDRFACDVVVSGDSGQWSETQPEI
ncbi:MAG TPA: M20/M25/M40 family metallo-hydrolase, partial [Chloroflexota bacterium]|nr:M20/M25/M40 family metallo-hydrolase [Chloroflexota bacterium]